jgi:hypothetical protein
MLQTSTQTRPRHVGVPVEQVAARPRLLTFLCPPRSFSSVCSTMIGQHPEMYGFPELHLMKDDTIAGVLRREENRGKFLGPPGMLRALAELDGGEQTVENVFDAHNWLCTHRDWPTKRVMDYVLDRVAATHPVPIAVEKSPAISKDLRSLKRLERAYPDGLYLHLTRHPLSNVKSIEEFVEKDSRSIDLDGGWSLYTINGRIGRTDSVNKKVPDDFGSLTILGLAFWVLCHTNILRFLQGMAADRVFRIKGEDLLSEPEVWLPKICRWAGVDDGPASIEAMMHPEDSPYATPGPNNARGGNDGKFLRSPALRQGRVREGDLAAALSAPPLCDELPPNQQTHLLRLAGCLGYK